MVGSDQSLPEGRERSKRGVTVNGYGIYFCVDENVFKLNLVMIAQSCDNTTKY